MWRIAFNLGHLRRELTRVDAEAFRRRAGDSGTTGYICGGVHVSICLCLLAACKSGPPPADHIDEEDLTREVRPRFVETAPIVVVGQILSYERTGEPRRSAVKWGILVQPIRILIAVENVLKGEVSGERLEFYFFVVPTPTRVGSYEHEVDLERIGYAFRPIPERRHVFFLKRDGRVLRSVGDVAFLYAPAVWSGSHRKLTLPPGTPIGQKISQILLTPGEGMDRGWFVSSLPSSARLAKWMTSAEYVQSLVRPLLEHENRLVREAACEALVPLSMELPDEEFHERVRETVNGCPSFRK
jgi:hypothetical protein